MYADVSQLAVRKPESAIKVLEPQRIMIDISKCRTTLCSKRRGHIHYDPSAFSLTLGKLNKLLWGHSILSTNINMSLCKANHIPRQLYPIFSLNINLTLTTL
jgi:hypothetical protein